MPVFSQDRSRKFQKTADGTGYYRSLGVEQSRDREEFFSDLVYTRELLSGAQYKSIIKEGVAYISFTIELPDSMQDTVRKTIFTLREKPYTPEIHEAAYEFIFPYDRGRPCYKIVVVLPQESWSIWDWARVWNILTPW
jgi:hypothetical protein